MIGWCVRRVSWRVVRCCTYFAQDLQSYRGANMYCGVSKADASQVKVVNLLDCEGRLICRKVVVGDSADLLLVWEYSFEQNRIG